MTLFEKLWQAHIVREAQNEPTLLYIDLHLIHEVTSPQAFSGLRVDLGRPGLRVAVGVVERAVDRDGVVVERGARGDGRIEHVGRRVRVQGCECAQRGEDRGGEQVVFQDGLQV